jgi:hypothetical protein
MYTMTNHVVILGEATQKDEYKKVKLLKYQNQSTHIKWQS